MWVVSELGATSLSEYRFAGSSAEFLASVSALAAQTGACRASRHAPLQRIFGQLPAWAAAVSTPRCPGGPRSVRTMIG